MNSPVTPAGQADMEEILSSIRSTLEEETGRVAKEQASAAASAAAEMLGEQDDVLELDAADMVEEPEAEMIVAADIRDIPRVDEIFDINAFATEGKEEKLAPAKIQELKADGLGEDESIVPVDVTAAVSAAETSAAVPAQEQAAADDFDRLLNELQTETASVAVTAPAVEVPVAVAEAAPAEDVMDIDAMMASAAPAVVNEPAAEPVHETFVETVVQDMMPAVAAGTTRRVQLAAIPGVSGLQIALPAEILAEALRPLVKDWVAENLAQVVERLVADEIEKLVKD